MRDLAPDLALLQEVGAIPEPVRAEYEIASEHPIGKHDRLHRFSTAVLVRGTLGRRLELTSSIDWAARELALYRGNLLAHQVVIGDQSFRVISVYSPAWPVDPARIAGVDVSAIKLTQNAKVWATELLWAALRETDIAATGPWIVAGDLNSSETFDHMWPGGPHGNKEILDRMDALGFTECLRHHYGHLVPTFKTPRGGKVIHQLDHLFVSTPLPGRLRSCITGDPDRVFGDSLSDHLPVIADFAPARRGAA